MGIYVPHTCIYLHLHQLCSVTTALLGKLVLEAQEGEESTANVYMLTEFSEGISAAPQNGDNMNLIWASEDIYVLLVLKKD